MIEVSDDGRIRTIRLDRPEAKNAMNTAMWDGAARALVEAAEAPGVAVVVWTGSGDSFSAGQDLFEMAHMAAGEVPEAEYGFAGLCDQLVAFPKPLLCAVNGIGLGFGATILGHADLAFMATDARLKCPFTSLGVAPELASSYTFPTLIGRQNATWALLSSEWLSAEECLEMGLVYRLCEPDELTNVTMDHARVLAEKPISSLMACKRTIVAGHHEAIAAARRREDESFRELMGAPANVEALRAFAEKRDPDFSAVGD